MSWSDLSDWWLGEVENDPAYETVVTPLLLDVLQPEAGLRYLDVGCGEGRVMRAVAETGAISHGIDRSPVLLAGVSSAVAADALVLPFASNTYDGVFCVLTLEHIEDHAAFFLEAARVAKAVGVLTLIMNHPIWTAPDSTPITDDESEVLWRPGHYFTTGTTETPAGDGAVTFFHRSMADLLNASADAGWQLERMVEQPHHEFEDQSGIPRLLACRWRLA